MSVRIPHSNPSDELGSGLHETMEDETRQWQHVFYARFTPPLLRFGLVALVLLSLIVLGKGISEPTGLTGKDEFYLGLRIPMEMIEQDRWLLPTLDGKPRLKKPPLMYWLGRLSYQSLGISLFSARLVGVLFGCLFVLATVAVARQLTANWRLSFLAGFILLGMFGMATESRRFMLDLPTAVFAALAFWAFLRWAANLAITTQDKPTTLLSWCCSNAFLFLAVFFLAAGFLVKGPVVFVLSGSGVLALLLSQVPLRQLAESSTKVDGYNSGDDELVMYADANGVYSVSSPPEQQMLSWRWLSRHAIVLLLALLMFLLLVSPWFVMVQSLYPQDVAGMLSDELSERRLFHFSLKGFGGFLVVALPWSFLCLALAWKQWRAGGLQRFLLLWLLLSVLPFCFTRSFERYLVGSMLPAAIFLALALPMALRAVTHNGDRLFRYSTRLGALICLLLGGGIAVFLFWFDLGGWYWLLLPFLYLLRVWWKAGQAGSETRLWHFVASPILFWLVSLALVFPKLQVNALPASIVKLAKTHEIAFYKGPQPAMLSILTGSAHRHYGFLNALSIQRLAQQRALVFCGKEESESLLSEVAAAGYTAVQRGSYKSLVSHGSGLRFARRGASGADWLTALRTRNLQVLQSEIVWYTLESGADAAKVGKLRADNG